MELKPCIDRLREMFRYDRESGVLFWIACRSNAHKNGDTVGAIDTKGRLRAEINGKSYAVHHIIWAMETGCWPSEQIDHHDQNKLNNRMSNLREATNAQNSCNRVNGKNSTGFKGVSFHKRQGKYNARIMKDGVSISLGSFDDPQYAAHEYNKAAIQMHGEFACLNPIGEEYGVA
jgi:hypothetical protein